MRGQRIEDRLGQIAEHLARVDAMLVVREPNTAYAADAYEGLRKSVQYASQQQRLHIATLIGLLDDIAAGASLETMTLRIQDRLNESGAQEVTDPKISPQAFLEVDDSMPTRPAWIHASSDQKQIVVRQGNRHRIIHSETINEREHEDTSTLSAPPGDSQEVDLPRDTGSESTSRRKDGE